MAINNNGENGEENLENSKKNTNSLLTEFKKEFIFESLKRKNDFEKNNFITDLVTSPRDISSDIKSELINFYEKNEKYSDIDIKDINNISPIQLKSLVIKDFGRLELSRNDFMKKVLFIYDIKEEQYNSVIRSEIKGLSINKLKEFIYSENKLDVFLKGIKGFNFSKKIKNELFSKYNITNLDKYNSLNLDDKNQIDQILSKLNLSGTIKDSDIRYIFGLDLIDDKFKFEFVNTFIPFINLEKAVYIGLINEQEADNKLIEITNQILYSNGLDPNLYENLQILNKNEVEISTINFNKIEQINLIAQEIGFKNFENNLNEFNEIERQNIINSGPQSFDELIEGIKSLNEGGRIKNIEKFTSNIVIEIKILNTENEFESEFIKVVNIDNETKKISYVSIGTERNGINIDRAKFQENFITKDYCDFFDTFKNKNKKFDFLDESTILSKIKSGNLKESEPEFRITGKDLNDDLVKKEKIKESYKEFLENKINYLKTEIDKNPDNNKTFLSAQLDETNLKLEQLKNEEILNEELAIFENFNSLILRLDEIDKDGKDIVSKNGERGLFKGIFLKTKKGGFYEIDGIDDGIITLKNELGKVENIDFMSFFEAFKNQGTKRINPIFEFNELITGNKDNIKNWEGHEIINGKLIAKNVEDGDEKGDREVEYLVGKKTDKIIKINNISGNKVKVQFGERKNNSDLSDEELKAGKYKKNKDGNYDGETLYIEGAEEYTISLNQLDDLIKEDDLFPDWQTGKQKKIKTPLGETNKFNKSISSWIFSHTSFSELIAGGKMFINSIEETLKKGNELHSAKAALAMGKFLPDELKQDLQIKVERAESEAMDKELESLGKVDSRIAVKRIKKWLLNNNCPEHKKEAGLLFMLEKYGHLTSKGALYEFRGKFLWYEAFGGRINDDFYNEIKAESESVDITFSEEYLMHRLLKKQCGSTPFKGHKRRSRLHKEFEAKWSNGVDAEFEKGYKDASQKRTARSMVNEGIFSEAAGGTTSNAIGWFKKAIERGSSLEEMSEGFFTLLYSGALYDVDQKTFMKIKGIFDSGVPIMMMRFSTTVSDMKLFNKTILRLSQRMQDAYGGTIGKEAEELYKDVMNKKSSEKDRLIKTQKFWKKYGKQLSRSLNLINTTDPTYSKTDHIIFLEKDREPIFDSYYKTLKAYVGLNNFDKAYMDEDCGEVGLTGIGVDALTKQYLKLNQTRQLVEHKIGPKIWAEFYNALSSINNKKLYIGDDDPDGSKDKNFKRRYLLNFLKELCSGFLSVASDITLDAYNSPTSDIGQTLNAIGLNLRNKLGGYSSGDVLNTNKADKILLESVEKILNGALDGGINITDDNYIDPLSKISEPIRKGTNDILST